MESTTTLPTMKEGRQQVTRCLRRQGRLGRGLPCRITFLASLPKHQLDSAQIISQHANRFLVVVPMTVCGAVVYCAEIDLKLWRITKNTSRH